MVFHVLNELSMHSTLEKHEKKVINITLNGRAFETRKSLEVLSEVY